MKSFDIVIIGSGILGVSLAYMLSLFTRYKICVIEQEHTVAYHASSRNSGKVHAPFIYHPEKKRLFAKLALLGFDMWEAYARSKNLPFKRDGVLEVALDEDDIDRLEEYMRWGEANGLDSRDLIFLDSSDIKYIEPEVRCLKAIYCRRDASTNYRLLANELARDAARNGVTFMMDNKVHSIKDTIIANEELNYKFLINAAGGEAVDIAHKMNIAQELTDIHFRGEYWKAPSIYAKLTRTSIYSVPKFPEYPFLDPHWLVKVDGSCEVGPNALPVFSPYAYNNIDNLKSFFPKLLEMLTSTSIILDKQFLSLAKDELLSSLSKKVMISRVKRFLPKIDADAFKEKGVAGIRSVVVSNGKFVSEPIVNVDEQALHILNYNSPGATGSLPFAIYIMMLLEDKGIIKLEEKRHSYWDLDLIMEELNNTII